MKIIMNESLPLAGSSKNLSKSL